MSFANIPGLKTYTLPEGLSDEERQKLIHKYGLESEKLRKEEALIKASKTPETQRIQYEYKSKFNMKEEDIPDFIKIFFIDPVIETSQKDIFIEQFCPLYLNNEQYRIDNKGKYIFIEDGKIKGIINSERDLDLSTITHKMLIKIN